MRGVRPLLAWMLAMMGRLSDGRRRVLHLHGGAVGDWMHIAHKTARTWAGFVLLRLVRMVYFLFGGGLGMIWKTITAEVEVEIDISDFDDDELIDEVKSRGLMGQIDAIDLERIEHLFDIGQEQAAKDEAWEMIKKHFTEYQ